MNYNLFNQPDPRRTIQAIRNHLISCGFDAIKVDVFLGIHRAHKHIFTAFEAKALTEISKGATRLSSKAIYEDLRREHEGDKAGAWEFNNNYTSYLGRVFAFLHPQHADKFEFREIKKKEAA